MSRAHRSSPPARSLRDALAAALLATLDRPSLWVVALAGFLVRGGFVVFLLPIVVLPTAAGVQARIGPLVEPLVFGQVPPALVAFGVAAVLAVAAWLLLGGMLGALADIVLIEHAIMTVADAPGGADDGEPHVPAPTGAALTSSRSLASAVAARLLAHIPLVAVLVWGTGRVVGAAYRELLTPFEVTTPLALRIAAAVPDVVAAILVAWLLGEAAGSLAVRSVVLGRASASTALVAGWLGVARRPARTATVVLVSTGASLAVIAPALFAAGEAWARARYLLLADVTVIDVGGAVGVFVALWLGGLVLAGAASAFRSALWTLAWGGWLAPSRTVPDSDDLSPVGTIGGAGATRPAGWPPPGGSGTL